VKGEVVFLYAFDVASEIVTARVKTILGMKPLPFEFRVESAIPRDLPLYRPLSIEASPLSSPMNSQPVRLQIRLYDLGVVTIAMRVTFEVSTLAELMPFHKAKLDNGQALDHAAKEICSNVCKEIQEFMIRSTPLLEPEAYTVFCLTEMGQVADINRWLTDQRRAVAGLLTETDADRLSEMQIGEALRIQRSYENTDLIVIDWDAALFVDLGGYVEDTLYVIELANLQLEEFRVMDRNLDRYLNQCYDDLERWRFPLLGVSASVLRVLRRFRVDLAKLADEVTHITKFFGDWYLARVYLGARDRFHLDHWRESVKERLAQLDQLYGVVHAEVYERRMLWLEVVIVILFLIDVIALLFVRH
jgi:hypothetical protein